MSKTAPKPAPTAAEAAPKSVKTVSVRVLRSHPDLGYFPGETADVSVEMYNQYKGDAENGAFLEKI